MIPHRVTARDLRLQLEWLHDEWKPGDVWANEKKIARFKRYLALVPEPFQSEARELLEELGRSQLRAGEHWRVIVRRLHIVVNRWNEARPSQEACGHDYGNGHICMVAFRNPTQLTVHREIVHGTEAA